MTALPAAPEPRQAPYGISLEEVRAIAKEAYIYGFPLVDSYRLLHAWFVDRDHHDYKGRWNEIHVTEPDSDLVHAVAGLDLRREPVVLSVPRLEDDRYYAVQANDLNTFIFAHVGTRATGNGAGHFIIAGPDWRGKAPKAAETILRCESEFALLTFTMQFRSVADQHKAALKLAGCRLTPLSLFCGLRPPLLPLPAEFIKPLTPRAERHSLEVFDELNFVLRLCAPHKDEADLMARFNRLGVGRNGPFEAGLLSPEARLAMDDGMADAWTAARQLQAQTQAPIPNRGGRADIKGDYLVRMARALDNPWSAACDEVMTCVYLCDAEHQRLDGKYHTYIIRFSRDNLPPVNAFWSLALRQMPTGTLYGPDGRHSVTSRQTIRDADGGVTLYIRRDSPGENLETNWLMAPPGPFALELRLFWPRPEAVIWEAPLVLCTH